MKKMLVANWKMNPATPKEAVKLFSGIKKSAAKNKKIEVVIAPPLPYLLLFSTSSKISLAAQDLFLEDVATGPYTGAVSASILRASGVSYTIVGHSERRRMGESDEIISKKILASLSAGLKTVLCVGEKEHHENAPTFVRDQIISALKKIPRHFASKLIIAYEPVWAISTTKNSRPDSPENFFEMSIYIRRVILDLWGRNLALKFPVLYGGSVNSKNARGFLEVKGASGLLVGGASLNPSEFNKILEAARNA